ncbi:hypothetical protein ACIF83_36165 [Streptomyces sp. NPDC085866]|uniref:hypothetical protein n=1 Tax=Streptomyces sp. NPDC085866 TaxID=3365736 RepID=UPI0037D58C7A
MEPQSSHGQSCANTVHRGLLMVATASDGGVHLAGSETDVHQAGVFHSWDLLWALQLRRGAMAETAPFFANTTMIAADFNPESVDRFAAHALTMPRSERWRQALSTALLGDWCEPLFSTGHLTHTAIGSLKAEARMLHRQLVPVWRRRTRHGRVLSLDAELGDGLSLYDLVAADVDLLARVTEGVFEDERLNAVLRGLTPEERRVVLARAYDGAPTWTEAAAVVGFSEPEAFGERVRRKTKRLAAEQRRRLAQCSVKSGSSARIR